MMIKSLIPILFLCLAWSSSLAQCNATLFLCRHGENIINMDLEDGFYQVYLTDTAQQTNLYIFDAVQENGQLTIDITTWVPAFGIYVIQFPDGNSCWGFYFFEACLDYLVFEGCIEDYSAHSCGEEYSGLSAKDGHFCLGDTTTASFGSFYQNMDYVTAPFHPDRLEMSIGTVIDYTETEVKIVWTDVGEECVTLNSTTFFGSELKSGRTAIVHPSDPMTISSDKGGAQTATICVGEEIHFTLDALDEIVPKWEINGSIYYGFENTLSFDQPGDYTLVISHQEDEGCSCTPDATYNIVVNSGDSPSIECKRTVCLSEATTYYSATECDTYIWDVGAGGLITDGGGPGDSYVTVEWTAGPTNEISLTTPSCFENACTETIIETINIIDNSIDIDGLDLVCAGDLATYSAPNYTGTSFVWNVSSKGEIVNGQGTNRIQIRWQNDLEPSTGMVSVTYDNCNIDCAGYAELNVSILPTLEIEYTSIDLCRNTEYIFQTNIGVSVAWILEDFDGNTTTYPSATSLTINLSEAGEYRLEAINSDLSSCNSVALVHFEVLEDIPPIVEIEGPQVICLGRLVKYTVPNLSSIETIIWEVVDGAGPPMNLGSSRSLFYTWTSDGPYQISASILNSITGCQSTQTIFVLNNDISLIGPSELCLGEEGEYTLPEFNGDGVTWSISPPSAGTIIEAKDDWARVIWSEVGAQQISALYCDRTLDIDVSVHPYPDATYAYDDYICFNEFSQLNISTDASNSIEVFNENNNLVSTSAISNISSGTYNIEISNQYGCKTIEEINIDESEEFEITINTLKVPRVCPPFNPFEIFSEQVSSNFTYQWYLDNIPVGTNSPSYLVTDLGAVHLVVIDQHGCQAESDIIYVTLCCPGGGGDPITTPAVYIDVTAVDCNNRDFEILAPYQSTTFNWNFGDPYSFSNIANGISVSHTFSRAGRYLVRATGDELCDTYLVDICGELQMQTLCEGNEEWVDIPLVADFSFEASCSNEPVSFIDETTKLPSVGNVNYYWDFGDASSGSNTSTNQTPTHIYSNPGTYEVTLETSYSGGCTSTSTQTVTIIQGPTVEIQGQSNYCLGLPSYFESNVTGENLKYKWDFGDPGSGNNNMATTANADHTFSAFGTFTVNLEVTDDKGCIQSTSLIIDVINNSLQGEITADIETPKCPEDIVVLSAPMVGDSYLWSTGETTPTIEVTNQAAYEVTITDAAGCEYSPLPYQIFNYDIGGAQIFGSKGSGIIFDSLDVCVGEYFFLSATDVPNADYNWAPVIHDGQVLDYGEHFATLSPGRYTYTVTVTDPGGGCSAVEGPYVVNVREELLDPVIISDNGNYCENSPITLSVESYDATNTYEWSNGLFGQSINLYASGEYEVTVTNEFGCQSTSEPFFVRPEPGFNEWMTGCLEVCFPKEFCLNLNSTNEYNLIFNGANMGPVNSTLNALDLTQPGDYQLQVTNQYGCQSISDILSLTATPEDQSLSGIVYLDENENSIFDGNDILQEGVTVYLMNGNTVVGNTVTDMDGYYNFDPVTQSNLRVVLDLSSIDFTFEGASDSTLVYEFCVEDKMIDFPLVSICENPILVDTFFTCPDEPILINGDYYNANEADTSIFNLFAFCDSTYIFHVLTYEEPEIALETFPSCTSMPNGGLMVNTLNGNALEYSLNSDFSDIDSTYSDLAAGSFMLYVRTMEGCIYSYPFDIAEIVEPELSLSSIESCAGDATGILNISTLDDDLQYSINGQDYFTESLFEDLGAGDYTLYVQSLVDECQYEYPFMIDALPIPEVELVETNTCLGTSDGVLDIQIISGSGLTFDLDGDGMFESITHFENLSEGDHVLMVQDDQGCQYELPVSIGTFAIPEFTFEIQPSCDGQSNGEVSIDISSGTVSFALNDPTDFEDVTEFNDLEPGDYTLYSLSEFGCLDSSLINITNSIQPDLELVTFPECEDAMLGAVEIISDNINMKYSLDGISFFDSSFVDNLSSGIYSLYYQIEEKCIYEIPFEIILAPAPILDFDILPTCEDEENGSVIISADGDYEYALDGINYSNENTINNLEAGEQIIYVLNEHGCSYEHVVSIITFPEPSFAVEAVNACENIDNGALKVSSDHSDLLVSINGSPFANTLTFDDLAAGTYELAVLDSNQCSSTQIIELQNNPPLEVEFEDYGQDCLESELEIKPIVSSHHGELQYSWNTDDTSESILVRKSGTYEVTISDFCDEQYLSTNIEISLFDEENPFYVANVFSPNDDNVNDCFQAVVDASFDIINFNIKVFDRWGNLLFSSNDMEACWDGRFNNREVVPGVYVYLVDMTVNGCDGVKEVRKMGDVTVIR